MSKLVIYGETHVGKVRPNNEDSLDFRLHGNGRLAFGVVADGVGGENGGEVASRLAVEEAMAVFDSRVAETDPAQAWTDALRAANHRVVQQQAANDNLARMATTIVACSLDGDRVVLAHLGDSRAYRYRGGDLIQLTRDHTVAEDMHDKGMDMEAGMEAYYGNIITAGIGMKAEVEPVLLEEACLPGDWYLLCSDGLSSYVSDATIQSCLDGGSPQRMTQALIDAALDAGGRDNITVILLGNLEDSN